MSPPHESLRPGDLLWISEAFWAPTVTRTGRWWTPPSATVLALPGDLSDTVTVVLPGNHRATISSTAATLALARGQIRILERLP